MSEARKSADQMAEDRTEMAFDRTVMALERTLMAWIRTSVSLISFGFTIYKFLEAVQDKGTVRLREHAPRNLGLFLITLGIGLLVLGIIQYKRALKRFAGLATKKIPTSLALIGAGGVILVGLFTLLNMFFGIGGF
jgi:putative membrane protein